MLSPKVYIVIVNFKQWEDTRDCLESVLRSTYTNYAVFVVDNNSGNNSLEQLSGWLETKNLSLPHEAVGCILLKRKDLSHTTNLSSLPKLIFIQNDENAGFAAGNNVALGLLRSQDAYFWLLNPDMIIKDDTLEKLVGCAKNLDMKSIVGTVVKSNSGNPELLFYGGHRVNFLSATVSMVKKPGSVNRLDYISGASLFSHASNLDHLGLLPEGYFLYWEETDWCYRAKLSGFVLAVCPGAICYDKVSTIIGKSFMSDYYYARNGLRFISKFRKRNVPLVLFFMSMRFMKRIMMGQWARARGVFKGTIDYFKLKQDEAK